MALEINRIEPQGKVQGKVHYQIFNTHDLLPPGLLAQSVVRRWSIPKVVGSILILFLWGFSYVTNAHTDVGMAL